jgi:hypothetical protein
LNPTGVGYFDNFLRLKKLYSKQSLDLRDKKPVHTAIKKKEIKKVCAKQNRNHTKASLSREFHFIVFKTVMLYRMK